jgi:hypothetical protein
MIRDLSSLHSPKTPEGGNFAAQVPEEAVERGSGFYLALALDALTVTLAFWCGILYREFLLGDSSLWGVALVATMLGICLALGLYLTKHGLRRLIVLAVAVVGLFIFTFSSDTLAYAGVAAPLSFLLIVWGEALGRARIANGVHVRFLHGAQPLLAKLATAFTLSGLLLFIPYWTPARGFLSKPAFEATFQASAAAAQHFYGEIDLTGTLGTFAESLARYRLTHAPDFRRLPPAEQERVTRDLAGTLKTQLAASFQVELAEEKTSMGTLLYRAALRTFGDFEKQLGAWFFAIWIVVMFLGLRALGVLSSWVSAGVAYIFFELFLAAKIIRFRGETTTQEVVEFI